MRLLLFVLCLLAALKADACPPLYWQIDPNYQVPLDETATVASHTLFLADVKTKHGVYPTSKTYTIFDIKGKGTYDSSNVKPKIVNDSIEVTGVVIVLDFQLYLMTTPAFGKGYDGNATATLANITVNYTKKPALIKGAAVWSLASLSPSIPNNLLSNNDTNPPFFNISDKKYFDDLISTDLYAEVSAYYNMNLSTLYAQALQSQAMSKTFNSSTFYSYYYPGSNTSINVNVSVSNFSISLKDGVAIGYYGQVAGNQDRCSSFVPDFTIKGSFFTQQLIGTIWQGFAKTAVWQPTSLDASTLKSRVFKFKMIDLDSIAPKVTATFSNLLEPLVAKCNLLTFAPTIEFDQDMQQLKTQLDWSCGLFRTTETKDNILKFNLTVGYRVVVDQKENKLQVRIAGAELVSSTWINTGYDIENTDLADLYLRDVVSSLSNVNTVGDGFLQPNRSLPKVTIKENYIMITDEKTELREQ